MSRSQDALNALTSAWNNLKQRRPTEGAITGQIGQPLYPTFDAILERWNAAISALEQRDYWNSSPVGVIADPSLATSISSLTTLVQNAANNGVAWLLTVNFLDLASNVQNTLQSITASRAHLSKAVAKMLTERAADDAEKVIAASQAANLVIRAAEEAASHAESAREGASEIEAASARIVQANEKVDTTSQQVELEATKIVEQRKSLEKLLAATIERTNEAAARETSLAQQAAEAQKELSETRAEAEKARKSVEEALRKVRSQGLAKSFQDRSDKLRFERLIWMGTFAASAISLLVVTYCFSIEITTFTYESLLVQLLRKLGVAAPLVWVGWYAARQIGITSRVQEDYEYKAASALAFQSYRDEVRASGDAELERHLLELAIGNFGENPVRLYDTGTPDANSPLEAVMKEMPPDKVAAVLGALGDQARNVRDALGASR